MAKQFKIDAVNIRHIISSIGRCVATDTITVNGLKVGYMDRYEPKDGTDSGWCFMSGSESQDYMDNPDNMGFYDVNTIANYDPAIIPYLDKPYGTSWRRVEGSDEFVEIEQPDF